MESVLVCVHECVLESVCVCVRACVCAALCLLFPLRDTLGSESSS